MDVERLLNDIRKVRVVVFGDLPETAGTAAALAALQPARLAVLGPRDDVAALRRAAAEVDVIILDLRDPRTRERRELLDGLNRLSADFPKIPVILNTGLLANELRGVMLRVNEFDAARLGGPGGAAAAAAHVPEADLRKCAAELCACSRRPVVVTRGDRGVLACDEGGFHEALGLQLLSQLAPGGAGGAALAALSLATGAGASIADAIALANFAGAVAIQKLSGDKTAGGAEILALAADPDCVYQPELAEDPRRAVFFGEGEIELCCPLGNIERGKIRHAVFDHDGTISTLREGWERVMEPVMIRAILGGRHATADMATYHRVEARVKDYIDKSTGIQTVIQMEALAGMVREFGFVPTGEVLAPLGYKGIYNRELMAIVNRRIGKLQAGELSPDDYTVKGAVRFLGLLRDRGVKLYLASGTDVADVRREAEAMGYAGLFDGGIYGAQDDVRACSKKMVINRIIRENRLHGSELVTLGDGPVELRESRKAGGLAVGIASDEVRRHGLNPDKRARLVRAGAQAIAPDFSQADRLIELLFGNGQA